MNKHRDTCSDRGHVSNPRLPVRRGRILALASVLAFAPMVTGFPQGALQATVHPVSSQIRQVGFVTSSVASIRAAKGATPSALSTPGEPDPVSSARAAAVTPVQEVTGAVTVVGVTWSKGSVSATDQFQIRTQTGATWGQWQSLDSDQDDGPDAKEAATAATVATGGTSPYVVTGASKFEVRSLTSGPKAPTAAVVNVVDPGESSADSVQSPNVPGAAAAAAAMPAIYPRHAWGANERLRRAPPTYGKVQVGFVHHTVSTNSYTARQVPAIIRGIYAYHVRAQGWDDIGYNFLVDRFGRTWEGRYGGVGRAVVGAQTANYNSVSTGIAAIGNFQVAGVPQAMTNAFKRIFAWKLSVSRIPAIGRVRANGKVFNRVSGHRNGFRTACPGRYLYARLPEIRAGVAAIMVGRKPAPKPAAPWATTKYTAYKGRVLRPGARGAALVVLQRAVGVTGPSVFGPKTRAAVIRFQASQRMARTGVVNRPVWDRLERRDHPLIGYRRVVVRQGSKGTAVVVAQRALRVPADGTFGPQTTAAVMRVQLSARLPQTGVVSGWTWVAIEKRMPR